MSLVNQKGYEQPLKDAYERVVNQVCYSQSRPLYCLCICFQADVVDVRYQYFDFHNECKNMRWDRINILIEKMQEDLLRQGYGVVIDTNSSVQWSLAISTLTCSGLIP